MTYKTNLHSSISFPYSRKSLEQKYQEQIDRILDYPKETNFILSIDVFDFSIFEYISESEFIEFSIKPIIEKAD